MLRQSTHNPNPALEEHETVSPSRKQTMESKEGDKTSCSDEIKAYLVNDLLGKLVNLPRKTESRQRHGEVLALLAVVDALIDLLDRQRFKAISHNFGDRDPEGV